MNITHRITVSFGLLLCVVTTANAAERIEKPNVLYIMADELGYYELSCMGHPNLRTPNIDQLARQGIRFTQALAGSSVCAPTRCCLMTGKHSGHTSVRSNGGGTPLREGEPTVASVLKQAGYATGGFGKWGCGGRGSTGVPEAHGFDLFVGYYDQVHAHSYYPPYIIRNSAEMELTGNQGGRSGQTYSHYVIMEQAKKFIRDHHGQPFFCYLPITPPHGMFDIPDSDPAWQAYQDEDWPLEARRYAAMVNMVDRNVGELRDLLTELGLSRKTIIFFSGDNGGQDYFSSAEHPRGFHAPNLNPRTKVAFRGHKGNLYEGGLRIPMIACWPGQIQEGRVSDLLWYFPDVLPTLAELASAPAPADVDGISIVPELLGTEVSGRVQPQHEYLYFELGQQIAVRQGDWKAIQPGRNRPWELYDLKTDITESNNLAERHPEVLETMQTHARDAHQEVQEGVFLDRANHEKDRRAKFGTTAAATDAKVHDMPQEGLLSSRKFAVVRVSSEARGNGKIAANAIDGDPNTHWHSQFQGQLHQHPHELVIDLGRRCEIRGVRYLARQSGGWNGAMAECDFSVSDDAANFGSPLAKVTFQKIRTAQDAVWPPVPGRFLRVRALSEVNGGPWASIAELGILGTEID